MDPKLVKEISEFLIKVNYPKYYDKHQRYLLRRRAANYSVLDGELYYIRYKGSDKEVRAKVVCSVEEADKLFIQFHTSAIGAHCGQLKNRDAISQRYYWPVMSADIERWCDPNNFHVILGAVIEPVHWILTVIFSNEKRSLVLDSQGQASTKIETCLESTWYFGFLENCFKNQCKFYKTFMKLTTAFMRKRGCQVSRWKAETMPHSPQKDGTSCGIFVLKYAEKILVEEPPMFENSKSAVCKYRNKVAIKLLKETDDLSDFCDFCGEQGSDLDYEDPQKRPHSVWIQCDACRRRFHLNCVGKPDTSTAFFCLACK